MRELKKVDDHNGSAEWVEFSKKLGRILKDAIRLSKKDLPDPKSQSLRSRLDQRLDYLIEMPWRDGDVKRLVKRLRRFRQTIFTFLDIPWCLRITIMPNGRFAPQSSCGRPPKAIGAANGANAQAILMSVYRTLKLRGLDPLDTIVSALKIYVITGSFPSLPETNLSVN